MRRALLAAALAACTLAAPAHADRAATPAAPPPAPAAAPGTYVVKSADVEVYAPKGGKLEARVLVDAKSLGATQASLTLLSLRNATQLPLHRQTSAKIIYVLDGYARVTGLGKALGKGVDVGPGDAVYVPAGVASGILAKCCKLAPSRFLVLYAPGGPETPYRDPASARTGGWTTPVGAEEKKSAPADAPQPRIAHAKGTAELDVGGGKGKVKVLFDAESAGDGAAYVGHLHAGAGLAIPEHVHATEAEILYIVSGTGKMTVDGVTIPVERGMAVHIPAGKKHSFETESGLDAVQFYTPSGPEQRFKKAASR